eukprot:1190668-Prorocentrum_minimum.AAC.1
MEAYGVGPVVCSEPLLQHALPHVLAQVPPPAPAPAQPRHHNRSINDPTARDPGPASGCGVGFRV